jgi:hypothetical protein
MNNKERMLLGGVVAFMCVVTLRPACAADRPDEAARVPLGKAVVVGGDIRLEYTEGAHNAGSEELYCNYLSSADHSGDKTFRFADGNTVVFSAAGKHGTQFVAADGAKTQIEDGERVQRKTWWCQEDGVVLFRAVLASGGNLSGVKVEWFDSRGARRTETQLNLPPTGEKVTWSYESVRPVDDCLGLTFRVQEGKSAGSAKLVEYKLCPTGI